jgi:hypothetical protein
MTLDQTQDRTAVARLVLALGFILAVAPAAISLAAVVLVRIGAIDWWTGYGQWLFGDGMRLPLALNVNVLAVLGSAAGLGVAAWAGVERFYSRAMLNVLIAGVSLWGLLQLR